MPDSPRVWPPPSGHWLVLLRVTSWNADPAGLVADVWENVQNTLWWTYKKQWKDPPFLMGKSTISLAIFHCYVSSPEVNNLEKLRNNRNRPIKSLTTCFWFMQSWRRWPSRLGAMSSKRRTVRVERSGTAEAERSTDEVQRMDLWKMSQSLASYWKMLFFE